MQRPIPFGKYLLLERISVGGMAEVFKAKSFGVEGFEKVVAIKRILPSMAEDADFIRMFIDEAKIAGQLSHANVSQIFELGKQGDSHFIAMEFVWGKDLLQISGRFQRFEQTMPLLMACFIVARLCDGLDYAHRRKDAQGRPLNIVHRDVSPQNILVSYEGEVKLIDFGIAKAATRSSRTQAGVLKGKLGYMSPEQVRGLPVDRRSDVFALGTILYELVTGERLFLGESDFSTLEKVRNAEVQPPSLIRNNIPPQLERIMMRALSRDVEDRYPWASELRDDLAQFGTSQQEVFTGKHLSAWMKEAFAVDLARERALLERHKKVGRDGRILEDPDRSPSVRDHVPMDVLPDDPDATRISDNPPAEVFGDGLAHLSTIEPIATPELEALIAEADTEIAATPAMQKARQTEMEAPMSVAAPLNQPTGGQSAELLPLATPSIKPSFAPALVRPDPVPMAAPAPVPVSLRPPALAEASVGRVARDVATGAVVALVVMLILIGGHWFLTRPSRSSGPRAQGLVVVASADGASAEVWVDAVLRGRIEGPNPLTLDGLSLGEHVVVVKRPGATEFMQKVIATSAKPAIVVARFAATADPGRLRLKLHTPGVTVWLDGQMISSEAAAEPILLVPGTAHEVLVKRDGYAEKTFPIVLSPGETRDLDVRLDVRP